MFNSISNLRSFYINSYYSQYTNTASILYNLDGGSYFENVNKCSITKLFISPMIDQFDPNDSFTLIEDGLPPVEIAYLNQKFPNYEVFRDDLEFKLNYFSPHHYPYIVTFAEDNQTMVITSTDLNPKSIVIVKNHIQVAFGMEPKTYDFQLRNYPTGDVMRLVTGSIYLTPIDAIYVNSNIINNHSANGNNSASIACVYDSANGGIQTNDLIANMKDFNGIADVRLWLTDFDGELISINANRHWWCEITFFYFDESLSKKISTFLNMKTIELLDKTK